MSALNEIFSSTVTDKDGNDYDVRDEGLELSFNGRSYSSTQVNITGDVKRQVLAIAARVKDEDLAEDGREDEPHITVKYGLEQDALTSISYSFGSIKATLRSLSLFKKDEYEVLKIDVDSPDLHRLNALIKENEKTVDTQPYYRPHVTIAYLKPGRGEKYVGPSGLEEVKLMFNEMIFSSKNDEKNELKLAHSGPRDTSSGRFVPTKGQIYHIKNAKQGKVQPLKVVHVNADGTVNAVGARGKVFKNIPASKLIAAKKMKVQ